MRITIISFVFSLCIAKVLSECLASYSQTQYQAWSDRTHKYTLWSVDLFSVGTETISSLRLAIVPPAHDEKLIQTWDLIPEEGGTYAPHDKGPSGIPPPNRLHFGYVITGTTPAIITLFPTCTNNTSSALSQPFTSPALRATRTVSMEAESPPTIPSYPSIAAIPTPTPSPNTEDDLSSCQVSISAIPSSGVLQEGEWSYREYKLSFTNTGAQYLSSVRIEVALPLFASMEKFYGMEKTCCHQIGSVAYFGVNLFGLGPGVNFASGAGFLLKVANDAQYSGDSGPHPLCVVRGVECS